jgi:spermidine synthase
MRDADPRDLGLKAWGPPVLLGFLAASIQVYLLREFAAEFYGNELTFGLFLGSWLLWGGLGSLIRPRPLQRAGTSGLAGLYGLVIGLFLAGLVGLRFSHKLLGVLPAELTGLAPALGASLVLGLLLSCPLGFAFVLNARLHRRGVATVYLLESAGAAVAGLLVHFVLVPHLSNWQGAALVAGLAAVAVFLVLTPGRWRPLFAAVVLLAAALAVLDGPAQRAAWKPLRLVASRDTLYGKLQVVRTQEQVTLFDNGLAVFSHPDEGAAEESVHFALLQRQGARRVLLIGGLSGGVIEALKYPEVRIDCVELDPDVIQTTREYLSAAGQAAFIDPRVRIIASDGRSYLARSPDLYDAVLLNLPEPATAQVNRYYTREFFLLVRRKLVPGGVLGFVLASSENYISDALAQFLSSVAATLRGVFPEVRAVPGATCVFLASDGPLTIDADRLSAAEARLGLDVRYMAPAMLRARLDPDRVARLAAKLAAPGARINRDLVPVSYYFHEVLWAGQFRGFESRLLRKAAAVAPAWVLDAPLGLFALGLLFLALSKKCSPGRWLAPVAVMGFTSITVELAIFIAFQARFGVAYGEIPLLVAMFMSGLTLGSAAGRARKHAGGKDLAIVQAAFILLLLATSASLSAGGGEAVPFVLLFLFGGLGGYLFVAANRRLLLETSHLGLGYGFDLLASFFGVVLASGLIIPLYGIPSLLWRLVALNALCLLFLAAAPRRR